MAEIEKEDVSQLVTEEVNITGSTLFHIPVTLLWLVVVVALALR